MDVGTMLCLENPQTLFPNQKNLEYLDIYRYVVRSFLYFVYTFNNNQQRAFLSRLDYIINARISRCQNNMLIRINLCHIQLIALLSLVFSKKNGLTLVFIPTVKETDDNYLLRVNLCQWY